MHRAETYDTRPSSIGSSDPLGHHGLAIVCQWLWEMPMPREPVVVAAEDLLPSQTVKGAGGGGCRGPAAQPDRKAGQAVRGGLRHPERLGSLITGVSLGSFSLSRQ